MSDVRGVGVDLCSIDRIEKAIKREHFKERVFTQQEIAYFTRNGRVVAESAAAMFAAKEAVSKALGTGFLTGIMPEHVEVVHDDRGAPGIVLHGPAEERLRELGGSQVHISLSHEANSAVAFAVVS